MRVFSFSLILFFGMACSGTKTVSPPVTKSVKSQATNTRTADCKTDADCVLIDETCCGCNQGGKKIAVNKTHADNLKITRKDSCLQTVCMQMISNDPSCKQHHAKCVDNNCVGH